VRSLPPMPSGPMVWNPRMPGGLRDGVVLAGGLEHPGGDYYHDASGLDNHGTLTNMNPATDWRWSDYLGRWACNFDGSNDVIRMPVDVPLIGLADFTASCWVEFGGAFGNTSVWMGRGDIAAGEWMMGVSGGSWRIRFYASTAGINAIGATDVRTLTGWHLVSARRTGGVCTVYLDGIAEGTDSTASVATSNLNAARLLEIGASDTEGAFDRVWTGRISDPMHWIGRAINPPEIQWLASPANHLRVPWVRRSWRVAPTGVVPPTTNRRRRLLLTGAY
jgi:hypothetical protein